MLKKKKIICFDLDGVICRTKENNYSKSKPIKKNIKMINYLHNKGHFIKIFTARYMGRSKEDSSLAKKRGYKATLNQLKKWKVNYDTLIFGKPSYDLFIDDKNLNFDKNWTEIIRNKIHKTK